MGDGDIRLGYRDTLLLQKEQLYRELQQEFAEREDGNFHPRADTVYDGFDEFERMLLEQEGPAFYEGLEEYVDRLEALGKAYGEAYHASGDLREQLPDDVFGYRGFSRGNGRFGPDDLGVKQFVWAYREEITGAGNCHEFRDAMEEAGGPLGKYLETYEEETPGFWGRFWTALVENDVQVKQLAMRQNMLHEDVTALAAELHDDVNRKICDELLAEFENRPEIYLVEEGDMDEG